MEKFFELVEEVDAKEVHYQCSMSSSPIRMWARFSATVNIPNEVQGVDREESYEPSFAGKNYGSLRRDLKLL